MLCYRSLAGLSRLQARQYYFGSYERPHQDIVDEFTKKDQDGKEFRYNRNPVNHELLTLEPQELGHNRDPDTCRKYYNRLEVVVSKQHCYASVIHHKRGQLLTASTKEPWIRAKLYRTSDRCAAYNLGRIMAHRLKAIGLHSVQLWDPQDQQYTSERVEGFAQGLRLEGMVTTDPNAMRISWNVLQDGESAHHFFRDQDKFREWLEVKREEHKERYDVE